ncbi:MAG: hypothetical protein KME29_34030 [Calothrix sp. FI2-JRJ7]|nr:hypothetical protein [Calothrix sp. FI2-JRJ7]
MKLKAILLGALFIGTTISAVIVTAPTRANITETSNSPKVWQIFTSGKCPTTRKPRRRTNISRARNDSCPKISR